MTVSISTADERSTSFRWIVYLALLLPLIGALFLIQSVKTKAKKHLAFTTSVHKKAEAELSQAFQNQKQLENKQQVSDFQRDQLASIYRSYRDIDDFPENPSAFVISARTMKIEMNDTLHLSVPKGAHVFSFRMTKTDVATKEVLDEQKIEFPMQGPAGYRVVLDLPHEKGSEYRDPRQLTLKITSTDDGFEPVSRDLLEPFPTPSESSSGDPYGRLSPVAFPNQFDRYDKIGTGVLVNRMRWVTKPKTEPRFNLDFEMRVLSDGPKVTHPFDRRTKETSYTGNGKYIIQPGAKQIE